MRRGSHPREVRMKPLARAAALAAVLLAPTAALSARRELPYTYQGRVDAVKARAVDIITGVGEALRLVQMRTQAATAVFGEGAAIRLGDLQPGDVVRADCRMTATGLVVDRIELKRRARSEEHTSELQSLRHLVCRLLLEKKKKESHATIVDVDMTETRD